MGPSKIYLKTISMAMTLIAGQYAYGDNLENAANDIFKNLKLNPQTVNMAQPTPGPMPGPIPGPTGQSTDAPPSLTQLFSQSPIPAQASPNIQSSFIPSTQRPTQVSPNIQSTAMPDIKGPAPSTANTVTLDADGSGIPPDSLNLSINQANTSVGAPPPL